MSKIEVDENDYYSSPLLLQTHKQVGQCNCHEAGLATPSCPMLCMYLLQWSHLLPKLIFWPVVKSKQHILAHLTELVFSCGHISCRIYSTSHCSSGQIYTVNINHFTPCILDQGHISCLGLFILSPSVLLPIQTFSSTILLRQFLLFQIP